MLPPSRLVAIADYGVLGAELTGAVVKAAGGGVTWFLLRARELTTGERIALAGEILAAAPSIFLSMHGDAATAAASGCGGVHIPSSALESSAGVGALLFGGSCHDAVELERAEKAGAHYCFLSPVYETLSKVSFLPPLGAGGFGSLAGGVKMPVYALGGSTPGRVEEIAEEGAYGAAVLGDLFLARDIKARAAQWVAAIERVYGTK